MLWGWGPGLVRHLAFRCVDDLTPLCFDEIVLPHVVVVLHLPPSEPTNGSPPSAKRVVCRIVAWPQADRADIPQQSKRRTHTKV